MKYIKNLGVVLLLVAIICLLPILLPLALIGGYFQTRLENRLRRRFIEKWKGEKVGVLAYSQSNENVADLISKLDAKILSRVNLVKSGEVVDELDRLMIECYKPDFDAAGPLDDYEEYNDVSNPYIDLRLILVDRSRGGASHNLHYHDEVLTKKRAAELVTELEVLIKEQISIWDSATNENR